MCICIQIEKLFVLLSRFVVKNIALYIYAIRELKKCFFLMFFFSLVTREKLHTAFDTKIQKTDNSSYRGIIYIHILFRSLFVSVHFPLRVNTFTQQCWVFIY